MNVDSAASSVSSQFPASRLTTAGGSLPGRSWVAGAGSGRAGRVASRISVYSRNQPPTAAAPIATGRTRDPIAGQNRTWTGPRSSPTAWNRSRDRNPPMPATMLVGIDWVEVLYVCTALL